MTIDEYAEVTPELEGRLALPSKPLAQRWLMHEPSGFGTTVYTYCEENTGCIVEDLVGATPIEDLKQLMMKERRKWVAIQKRAEAAAKKRQLEKENKSSRPLDNGASRCDTNRVADEQPTNEAQ
jgi:hypothetical protein